MLRIDHFLTSPIGRLSEYLVEVNNLKVLLGLSLRFPNCNLLLCFRRQINRRCLTEYIFTVVTIIRIIMFTIFLFRTFLILCCTCTMRWSSALLCNSLYWPRKIYRFRRCLRYRHRYLNLNPTDVVIWKGDFLLWCSFIFIRYVQLIPITDLLHRSLLSSSNNDFCRFLLDFNYILLLLLNFTLFGRCLPCYTTNVPMR